MKNSILCLLALILISCTTDDNKPIIENELLLGTWKVIEQLVDPGDGSGTFQPVVSDRTITFLSNGTVEVNGELCFISLEVGDKEFGTFKIISSNEADTQNDGEIVANTCDSLFNKIYFDLPESGNLIIWYQCIEACAQKFSKI